MLKSFGHLLKKITQTLSPIIIRQLCGYVFEAAKGSEE